MELPRPQQSFARFAAGARRAAHRVRTWTARGGLRRHRQHTQPTRYFLFVGDAGSCLGGMQDYYGGYDSLAGAIASAPPEVHWAEVAIVADGCLEVVATGERLDTTWRWCELEEPVVSGAASRG